MLDELNRQQKEAAEQIDGPLLILAGAGSGKTKTLTHRIANIVSNHHVLPANILAVTFTNKAANEMRERLWQLIGDSTQPEPPRGFMPWMGTFHSICVRMLRLDGDQIGIPKNFVIFDEADRLSFIKQSMRDLSISEKDYAPKAMANLVSSAKNEGLDPSEYAELSRSPVNKVVAKIYPHYERLKKDAKALDFDDLLLQAVRLLVEVPESRNKWTQQFRYILVDEYQDTNAVQYKLIKLLVGDKQNLCVVGDDWQSVYSWRGADFTNILNFERDFKNVKVIKLEQNYRSTKPILDAAQNVISKNTQRSDKKLVSQSDSGEPVQVLHVASEMQEAETIARRIKTAIDLQLRKYDDFAILYRTNAQSRALEEVFLRYALPYKIIGGTKFYDRAEIKDVLAYLRLIYQPADRASFLRIANVPTRGIGKVSLQRFLDWRDSGQLDLITASQEADLCPNLPAKAVASLKSLGGLLANLQSKPAENLHSIINSVIKQTNYLQHLDDGTVKGEDRQSNVKELLSDAEQRPDMSLAEYLEEVALVSAQDQSASDSVSMMTLHAAKGLEFPVVFMVGLEEGLFPSAQSVYEVAKLEEERRLCYVGMTRAREELFMTTASSRLTFGSRSYNMPSRFIADAEVIEISAEQTITQPMPQFANTEPQIVPEDLDLAIGDRVKHQIFGIGKVTDMEGSNVAVLFKKGGVKKLNISFAPLEKL